MRTRVFGTLLLTAMAVLPSVGKAQRGPAEPKTFTSAADIQAMIAKAKAERKPDQANFLQPILRLAPYTANMEYRVKEVTAPSAVHENETEMMYVIEGSGTLTQGGKLHDEKRSNPTNLLGMGIDGGTPKRISKGDWVIVPEGVAHAFSDIDSVLVLMTFHLPRGGSPSAAQ